MADLLSSVAQLTGMKLYAQRGPFQNKKGFVCGIFNGYLTVFAAEPKVGIAVVAHELKNPAAFKQALASNEPLKQLGGSFEIKTGNDGVMILWKRMTRPSAEAVRTALTEIAKTAGAFMAPHNGRCMKCNRSATNQLVMLGAMPRVVCESCLSTLPEQKLIAQQKYAEMQPRTVRGLAYLLATIIGLVAVYGTVIGVIGRDGTYEVKLEVVIGLAFASFCMMAFHAGAGKQTRIGMVASGIAGAAGKWICSTVFFTSMLVNRDHYPMSTGLVAAVAQHLPQLATHLVGGTVLFYVALALPLGLIVSPIPEKKFPEYEFSRLDTVATPAQVQSKTMAMAGAKA